jgi:hypothetical protein
MNEIQLLATRARAGDRQAREELRRELEDKVAYIVRRAVRKKEVRLPLVLKKVVEVAGLETQGRREPDQSRIVARVTRHICDRVLDGLDDRAQGHPERETVCN